MMLFDDDLDACERRLAELRQQAEEAVALKRTEETERELDMVRCLQIWFKAERVRRIVDGPGPW